MRVRVQTSPLGMCLRIAGIFLLGGVTSLFVEHSDWLAGVRGAAEQMSVPIPAAPTASPSAVPKPSASPAAVAPKPKTVPPSGWMNIGGILIPPVGYNDR